MNLKFYGIIGVFSMVAALGSVGCSSKSSTPSGGGGSCVQGAQPPCNCPGATVTGTQTCQANGQLTACVCSGGSAGSGGSSSTSTGSGAGSSATAGAGAGAGAAGVGAAGSTAGTCTPNAAVACLCPDGVTHGQTFCQSTGQPLGACLQCSAGTAGTSAAGTSAAGTGAAGTGTADTGTAGSGAAGTTATAGCPAAMTCAENTLVASFQAGLKFCGTEDPMFGHKGPTCTTLADCATALPGSATCQSIPIIGSMCIKTCQ